MVLDNTRQFLLDLFGWGSAEDQEEATSNLISWAVMIALFFSALIVVPFPFNAFILLVITFWAIAYLRHRYEVFNTIWCTITLRRWRS